jgi:hypothetical protein
MNFIIWLQPAVYPITSPISACFLLGTIIVLAADTYRSIFDNILSGILEYFNEHYERGVYFEEVILIKIDNQK